MRVTTGAVMGIGLGALVLATAGCGGGDGTSTVTSAPAATAAPTTQAPTTQAPTTTIDPVAQFDEAVRTTLETALVLADLRTNCLITNDLSCLLSADAELVEATDATIATLEAVGAASVAAGADAAICSDRVESLSKSVGTERSMMKVRAEAEAAGDQPFGQPDALYQYSRVIDRIAAGGHEISIWLLTCIDAVRAVSSEQSIAQSFGNLVYTSEVRARPSLSFNVWAQYLCVDANPSTQECVAGIGGGGPALIAHMEELGYAYEDLLANPDYGSLPAECQAAAEEATARLQSSYEIYLSLSDRELLSSEPGIGQTLARGVFQIDDRKRSATAPLYPLDESTVLRCTAAIFELGA